MNEIGIKNACEYNTVQNMNCSFCHKQYCCECMYWEYIYQNGFEDRGWINCCKECIKNQSIRERFQYKQQCEDFLNNRRVRK